MFSIHMHRTSLTSMWGYYTVIQDIVVVFLLVFFHAEWYFKKSMHKMTCNLTQYFDLWNYITCLFLKGDLYTVITFSVQNWVFPWCDPEFLLFFKNSYRITNFFIRMSCNTILMKYFSGECLQSRGLNRV